MPNRFAHPTNLTISTFVNHDAQNSGRRLSNFGRSSESVLEFNSIAQAPNCPLVHLATCDFGEVFLFHTMARMSDAISELTIIGHEQQTLSIHIKPTDRKDTRLCRNIIDNNRATVSVA
jgi:hypothetical protein